MEEWQIEAFLEGSEDVYCQRRDYRQKVMNIVRASFNKEGLGLSKFIEDRNFVFDKFVFVSDNPANSDAFIRSITSFIDVIDRGKGMYECVPKGFSKASAMQLLSEHLNISMDNTWAFGDSSNDLPMFEAAAHGIAMGDHSSVLEPFSEMITDTVDNDGIAKALSHFGLDLNSSINPSMKPKGLMQIEISASAPFDKLNIRYYSYSGCLSVSDFTIAIALSLFPSKSFLRLMQSLLQSDPYPLHQNLLLLQLVYQVLNHL